MALKIPTRNETAAATGTTPEQAVEIINRRSKSIATAKSGFEPAQSAQSKRMIINLCGEEKTGKDHTAMTFPEPIYIHSFDVGLEGVVDKFLDGRFGRKKIYVADYELEVQPGEASAQEVADCADRLWTQFIANYKDGLASCGNGTVICDTISELWELLRLARFGKLSQILPHLYGPVNAEFRDVIRASYNHDGNTVLLSKLVDEWENYTDSTGKEKGRKTGSKTRKGFGDLPFLVQVNATCNRTDLAEGGSEFSVTIDDCRFNASANGVTVPNDYELICMTVFE